MNQRTRRSPLYGMVTAAALSLLLVGPALAQDSTSVTVSGTPLTMTIPLVDEFAAQTIDGTAKTPTVQTAVYSVSDFSGTGAGWNITAKATQFTTGGATPITLVAGSLSQTAPTVTAEPGTTSGLPTGLAGGVIDVATAVKVASAAVGAGMGKYNFSATTATLTLPSDVKVGTYTSTVTLTAATAP